jgi:hypothetical protein
MLASNVSGGRMQETQNFRTRAASDYLKSRGVSASPSFLEKVRARGTDDGRDRGPDYWREGLICWYSKQALDDYVVRRLAARKFRESVPQPAHFRRGGETA